MPDGHILGHFNLICVVFSAERFIAFFPTSFFGNGAFFKFIAPLMLFSANCESVSWCAWIKLAYFLVID